MSLENGSVRLKNKPGRKIFTLAFLGFVEVILTVVLVITFASNILFPEKTEATANAVSRTLSYEGRLTDANGNPLGGTGTNYCFRFSIYDNPTVGSGTKLWPSGTPDTDTVNVVNGVFSTGVGSTTNFNLDSYNFYDNDTVYLNVEATSSLSGSCAAQVSFVTLSPRQRMDAVAFARATRDVYGSLLRTINSTGVVQVGTGAGTTGNPILFSLDVKSTAAASLSYVGQTCTANGTLWYNSSTGRALLCEAGLVQELGTVATTTVAGIGTNAAGAIAAGTVVFSNSNGVTFGQNGSTITASAAGGGGGAAIQGSGTYTQNTGTIQFQNLNGVTFGLSNNGVMTASVNAGGGAAAQYRWHEILKMAYLTRITHLTAISARPVLQPFKLGGDFTLSRLNWLMSRSTSGSNLFTVSAAVYSYLNDTQLTRIASASASFSNTATASVSGVRRFNISGFSPQNTFSHGGYVMAIYFSAADTASMNYSIMGGNTANPSLGAILPGANQYNTATSYNFFPFYGRYSTTTNAMPDTIGDNQVIGQFTGASQALPIWFGLNND